LDGAEFLTKSATNLGLGMIRGFGMLSQIHDGREIQIALDTDEHANLE
jgi:hypothetical protein